ncbi:hypothetical protein [Pseudofrankia asymbiotica]|uniref:Bacterial Ig-like domain-containing protein n=1 Tax=Pseudofrankia asymbiotica TaxID=1834516 RepID=A0A1V2IAN7_9ACTN|nr:hypothetical protein [Pseudofrankia asymbiotica]ONH29782.1 hypothetical protein BL253_16230 [Pseudofrankia asymbiotica]
MHERPRARRRHAQTRIFGPRAAAVPTTTTRGRRGLSLLCGLTALCVAMVAACSATSIDQDNSALTPLAATADESASPTASTDLPLTTPGDGLPAVAPTATTPTDKPAAGFTPPVRPGAPASSAPSARAGAGPAAAAAAGPGAKTRPTVTLAYVRGGTITIRASGNTGGPPPSGTVTVTDGESLSDVYTVALASGQGGISTASVHVAKRDHVIWADYAGDDRYTPTRSATLRQPLYAVSITVGPIPDQPRRGQPFTITAQVSPTGPGPALVGRVSFQFEGRRVAEPVGNGSVQASLVVTGNGGIVTVTYDDDDLYRGPLTTTDSIVPFAFDTDPSTLPTAAPAPGTNP